MRELFPRQRRHSRAAIGQQTFEIVPLNHAAATRAEAEKPHEYGDLTPIVVHVAILEVAVTPEVAGSSPVAPVKDL
jgi:hypothetical protein